MTFAQRFPRLADLFGIDLRTLALFRFALGAVLFAVLVGSFCHVSAFWTDAGVMPRAWLISTDAPGRVSLYLAGGETWFATLLLLLQTVCALMFTLGWRTRTTSILSFLLWSSLLSRNPMVLTDGDTLMACLLFWSMFLPLGARFSVDAALSSNPTPSESSYLSAATVGLLLQVMSMYFFSALLGSGSDAAAAGLAQLPPAVASGLQWLQLLGPLLIFSPFFLRPLRLGLVAAFMLVQIGLLLCLELGHLPYVSLAALTAFVGGWIWEVLDRRHAQAHPGTLQIYFDRDCRFCQKSCRLLQQFLILPRAEIAAAQDRPRARTLMEANHSWVVIDAREEAFLKWPAFVVLLRHSPLLGWLWRPLRSPKLEGAGNALYDFVARHRGTFGRITACLLPEREINWSLPRFWHAVAALFVALMLLWNLDGLRATGGGKTALAPLFRALHIDQRWSLLTSTRPDRSGWLVVSGRLADGSEIDVLHPDHGAPSFEKPSEAAEQNGVRWQTYRDHLWDQGDANQREYYARYLCRTWNAARNRQALSSLRLIYMLETSSTPGAPVIEQRVLWRQDCAEDVTPSPTP